MEDFSPWSTLHCYPTQLSLCLISISRWTLTPLLTGSCTLLFWHLMYLAGFFYVTLIYNGMGCAKRWQFSTNNTLTAVASKATNEEGPRHPRRFHFLPVLGYQHCRSVAFNTLPHAPLEVAIKTMTKTDLRQGSHRHQSCFVSWEVESIAKTTQD